MPGSRPQLRRWSTARRHGFPTGTFPRHGDAVIMSLTRAMSRHAGVFATSDALAAGVHPKAIGPLLRSGEWRRIRFGVYTTADVWHEHEAMGRAHRLECAAVLRRLDRSGAAVSHGSAARLHGLVLPRSPETDVRLTDPEQFRTGRGYRISEAALPLGDVVIQDGVSLTTVPRTLADVGREWALPDTVVAVDDALADGRTTLDELRAAALAQTHWVGCGRAARAFSLARVGAHSPHETLTRLALLDAGLPEPLLQQAVRVGSRLIAVLDMYWPEHGVFAECDGRVKYTDPWRNRTPAQVLWDEKRRQDDLLDLDLRGVRIAPEDLDGRLDGKVTRLRALLSGGRPGAPRYRTELWNAVSG
ncbi:type IV toxin-antitoxin system AbiEi family antitoxin domain-containing protein [Modestobacter roseus]|uniref:type IV toxin-antitoxin system AbiEi family antitoxin domain-containing protein n=1 Tax=Modestobacter roseus TaxID=1181884 RepID=UPI0034DE037D